METYGLQLTRQALEYFKKQHLKEDVHFITKDNKVLFTAAGIERTLEYYSFKNKNEEANND
jgi:hypothetical protein